MNRASSPTGWVRNPIMISPNLNPHLASSYELGWTYNPITGCLNGCSYCYARKLANGRLKPLYLANHNMVPFEKMEDEDGSDHWQFHDPFYPRFWEERLLELPNDVVAGKERGIFVCDMGDLFGIGVPESWTRQVLERIQGWAEHRFYLLTKQPQNLIKFSPFPENCWVGVTATNHKATEKALHHLFDIEAKVRFISFEPLLGKLDIWAKSDFVGIGLPCEWERIDWLIIGACTGIREEMEKLARNNSPFLTEMPYGKKWTAQPNPEWVREIVEAADNAGIPVFLKDNLRPLLIPEEGDKPNYLLEDIFWTSEKAKIRQEMPE